MRGHCWICHYWSIIRGAWRICCRVVCEILAAEQRWPVEILVVFIVHPASRVVVVNTLKDIYLINLVNATESGMNTELLEPLHSTHQLSEYLYPTKCKCHVFNGLSDVVPGVVTKSELSLNSTFAVLVWVVEVPLLGPPTRPEDGGWNQRPRKKSARYGHFCQCLAAPIGVLLIRILDFATHWRSLLFIIRGADGGNLQALRWHCVYNVWKTIFV